MSADNKLHTSQSALPQVVCEALYTTAEGYRLSLATDNVFSGGYALQLAAVIGSVSKAY